MGGRVQSLSHVYFLNKVDAHFQASLVNAPGAVPAMWFEIANQTVLDAQLPLGVLSDALLPRSHEGPIPITVHFSKLPDPGVCCIFLVVAFRRSCSLAFHRVCRLLLPRALSSAGSTS